MGISLCIYTFNLLINCYCHLGLMSFAFFVLGKNIKNGCESDTVNLNTLMKGLCINGGVRKALQFHDSVRTKGF